VLDTFILYNDLCLEIDVIEEQIKLAEAEREQWWIGGRLFDSVPMNNAAERFDKLTDKIERMETLVKKKKEVKAKIEKLMNQYEEMPRKVAYMKFVQGKTLKEIAIELNYNYDYVREIFSKMKRAI
jgi:DNA-directed RNA polymerase specialized sigma24 family protein